MNMNMYSEHGACCPSREIQTTFTNIAGASEGSGGTAESNTVTVTQVAAAECGE